MRSVRSSGGLKVQAVAGTYVVSFGFDLPETDCAGLLGFSIHRTDHVEKEAKFLTAMKAFKETDPGFPAGAEYSTEQHPIQSFQWADYSAKPGHRYTYRIIAQKGSPKALTTHAEVAITITTESPETGDHDIYFNRGLAASQEYVRRFGDRSPDNVGDPDDVLGNPAYVWLSRGLFEAMLAFIEGAEPGRDELRIAAYEFTFSPFLDALKRALDGGVDIRIVYDGREDKKGIPGKPNRTAVGQAGLANVSVERTRPKSVISHNKFIVKLRDGEPVAVWTGGTNFSKGGIFGHSNVAHLVEDPAVAKLFLAYWTLLADDLQHADLVAGAEAITPLPIGKLPKGTTPIFSPRHDLAALDAYAKLALSAQQGLMMTFAFGMNDVFKTVYRTSTAPLRFALLEKKTRPMEDGPEKLAEEAAIQQLRNMPQNVFAVGNLIGSTKIDGWVKERLSGLNSNIRYVHNKFMLIDPLGNDPIVIAGSANFSAASTQDNDENMIVVRGNKRVADIYLGEFMRLWTHHAFRESLQWRSPDDPPKPLRTDDWWRDAFGDTERATRRKFFAPA
jgi:phosphatidylserine/phosphatidylglycerophosphate/cardiolipin synthase-like enzyme